MYSIELSDRFCDLQCRSMGGLNWRAKDLESANSSERNILISTSVYGSLGGRGSILFGSRLYSGRLQLKLVGSGRVWPFSSDRCVE